MNMNAPKIPFIFLYYLNYIINRFRVIYYIVDAESVHNNHLLDKKLPPNRYHVVAEACKMTVYVIGLATPVALKQ